MSYRNPMLPPLGYTLSPRLISRLAAHAAVSGDDPRDVMIDALTLYLDAAEAEAEAEQRQIDDLLAAFALTVGHAPAAVLSSLPPDSAPEAAP